MCVCVLDYNLQTLVSNDGLGACFLIFSSWVSNEQININEVFEKVSLRHVRVVFFSWKKKWKGFFYHLVITLNIFIQFNIKNNNPSTHSSPKSVSLGHIHYNWINICNQIIINVIMITVPYTILIHFYF